MRVRGPAIAAVAALAAALALGTGCDRAVEPYVPGEQPEQPDLSRIFPEGADRAAAREAQPGEPAAAPPRPGPRPPQAASEGQPLSGTIALAADLTDRVPPGAVLFLIARTGGAGPPLAVQRIPGPRFPLEFSIGPEHRMIQARPFAGPLKLSVRLDADGDAMSRQPGDLVGSAPGTYQPGASDIAIVIDEALP